jgi:hypothetical protein
MTIDISSIAEEEQDGQGKAANNQATAKSSNNNTKNKKDGTSVEEARQLNTEVIMHTLERTAFAHIIGLLVDNFIM